MTYEEFIGFWHGDKKEFIHLYGANADIGGGRITIEEIDQLSKYNSIEKLMISGLNQDTFEYFVKNYADRCKYIKFFKNKLVEDLSVLSRLENVVYIEYFFNQRVTKLWEMSGNKCLSGLFLNNFSRLHTLDGVQTAPALKHLHFGDAVWDSSVLTDIDVLIDTKIETFAFWAKKIEKHDISVYWNMPYLKHLDFASNLLETEDIAKIIFHCPNVEGYSLKPFIEFEKDEPLEKNILICGKRKPLLDSEKDKDKILKYINRFNELVSNVKR